MTKQDFGDLIISFTDDFYRIAKAILKEDADCEDAMSSAIVKEMIKSPKSCFVITSLFLSQYVFVNVK